MIIYNLFFEFKKKKSKYNVYSEDYQEETCNFIKISVCCGSWYPHKK